jgi:hypothetical protein
MNRWMAMVRWGLVLLGALWTAGINLYHHGHVKTQVQVDHVAPTEGDGETAARLQLTLGF